MTWLVVRAALPRLASTALSQAGAAARAAAPFVVWSVVAVALGLIVGFAAVILPPTGAFGIVAVAGLVLLWAMPDLRTVPDQMIRRLLFLALIVDLCVPNYYTIQVAALPWISARRIVTFLLIVVFAIAFSGSSSARSRMATILRDSPIIAICAIGYFVMAFVSIFTSINPPTSISGLTDAVLSWYVPLMVVLYVVRSEEDVLTLARVLCWCAIFVTCAGAVEFALQKNIFVALMPHSLVDQLASANPSFERMITVAQFRNGLYRAEATYNTPLSFGEFEAMILPVGYFFLIHSTKGRDTLFGVLVTDACLIGVFCSGSRGGYMASIFATAAFSALLVGRSARFDRRSLAPVLLAVVAVAGFATLIGLIEFSTRIRNSVTGGGADYYSNEARYEQWQLGIPRILSNPITGHGFDLSGEVVGYHAETGMGTIDSYVLSTLVETGVPGFVFFFSMVFAAAGRGVRQYLLIPSRSGALAGAFGCALLGFGAYRFALSQHENFTLLYAMVGLIMFLNHRAEPDRIQESHRSSA